MVIEVVVGDVGEDSSGEGRACDAFLHDAVGADLHEAVVAAPFGHFGQHGVETDGVRRGVRGGTRFVVDPVNDRGDEARLVAESAEQVVEQSGGRGFAVGTGHAHQFQLPARLAVESRGDGAQDGGAVRHHDVGHFRSGGFGKPFAYDRCRTVGRCLSDVVVSVARTPFDGEK